MKTTTIFVFFVFILVLLPVCCIASPSGSFTHTRIGQQVTLTPILNSDVTHYKWILRGKNNNYNSETGWITYTDRGSHNSILANDWYFVTLYSKNIDTGETHNFTNRVHVYVKEETQPAMAEKTHPEDPSSRIIQSLPEPLKSFFMTRSSFELALLVFAILLFLAFITRKKKIKKYVQLERYK